MEKIRREYNIKWESAENKNIKACRIVEIMMIVMIMKNVIHVDCTQRYTEQWFCLEIFIDENFIERAC